MKLGIIGGSGLYDMDGLEGRERIEIKTPFGPPSDAFIVGKLEGGCQICFLPRHGVGHRLLPSEINHKANIYAFKTLGVERIVSVSAVGSLKEKLRPRDIVLPDQYFDRTKGSLHHTFFGEGIVAHVPFGDPACPELRRTVLAAVKEALGRARGPDRPRVTAGGTYVNMEGPAFSTRAESNVYRKLGFDVIGMTSLPEAKLSREAEICYQAMAMVTDYDCWHETEEHVTVEMIVAHLNANVELARKVIRRLAAAVPPARRCGCADALKYSILTPADRVPAETREKLKPIIGRYIR